MLLNLSLLRPTAVEPSPHVLRAAAMFGLGVDDQRTVTIIPPVRLALLPGCVVFITGPSGSGKSSLLRLIDEALADRADARVIRFDRLPPLPEAPLVDCLAEWVDPAHALESTLRYLSLAGLNDAFVMLRKPGELSDGQRYRLRLAQTLAMVDAHANRPQPAATAETTAVDATTAPSASAAVTSTTVILADEFGATLDRLTAQVLARNVRKWTTRSITRDGAGNADSGVCFVLATTHDDLLESLQPDVLIHKPLGEQIEVITRETATPAARKDDLS